MLVTSGKDTLVRLLQEEKASLSMLVTNGKDTSVRLLQDSNAF